MATDEKITTKLEVDVTQFKKGLQDANRYIRMANSEFDAATASAGKFTDSADGLRAKVKQLTKVLEGQEAALRVLKHEYNKVAAEQGENSKGAEELKIKMNKQQAAINKTEAALAEYKAAAKEAADSTDDISAETLQNAAKAAGNLARNMAKIAGKTIVTGIKTIGAATAGLVGTFLATGEATKEYASEMAKLDTAYKANGHNAETAKKTYEELIGVIGETDQAVEAAQQIALLTKSEKDAAKWAELGAGVVGRFGDALQPETFFEAANETIKLGEATGAYTQMLEGTGYSVDKFNAGLEKCKTEAEKQAYMLKITKELLGSASEEYKKNNAAIIENNKATAEFNAKMAQVGQAATPVTTALKLIGAAILSDLMPNIKTLGDAFTGLLNGTEGSAEKMGTAVSGILQNLGKKIIEAAPTILNVGRSVVTSLVQGIIAAVPTLAGGVSQIIKGFMAAAPQFLSTGSQLIKQLINGVISFIPQAIDQGAKFINNIGEGLKNGLPGLISNGLDILMNLVDTLYKNAPKLIDAGMDFLKNIVTGIMNSLPTLLAKGPEIITKFANIINDNFPRILKKGVEIIGEIIKGIIRAIPTLVKNIPKIIKAIVSVWEAFNWLNLGKKAMTLLKDGILKMLGGLKGAGKTVLNSLTNIIKELPGKLLNLGKTAITSLGSGIKSMIGAARSAGSSVLSAVVNVIKALPGNLLTFGKSAISNLGSAIGGGIGAIKTKAASIANGVIDAFKGLPGKMINVGKEVINGVISGIGSMVGALYNSITDALGGLVKKAKNALGIASPSKVMAEEVGKWLPAGIAEGITKNTKAATKAMVDTAKKTLNAANAELSGAAFNVPVTGKASATQASGGKVVNNYYNQTINSPKQLNRLDIYRQSKNLLKYAGGNA